MSELLREVARHLRHAASESGTPDCCAVVVITIGQDGNASSLFFGDEDAAETAAHALPHVAADFVRQMTGAGFAIPEVSLNPRTPADTLKSERIAAQVIRKARQ